MAMENIKNGRLIYHLTKLENLESIIDNGLVSRKLVHNHDVKFSDVADKKIIVKRVELGLDSYVPFHFHPYSSFDKAVKSDNPDADFVYITLQRSLARSNDFKILPRHPLANEGFELLDYDQGMKAIDWDAMHTHGTEDDYIRNVKMAECLTEKIVPVKCFNSICVKDERVKGIVEKMFKDRQLEFNPPYVNVQVWFE